MDCSLIAAQFSWFNLESWIGIFWMVAGLGFIIFVHELGHFLAAKSCGVKVEAFYVGFNVPFPKIFGVTIIPQYLFKFTIGETEYGVGNLPLGGYVKMLGQEDTPSKPDEDEGEASVDDQEKETNTASEDDSPAESVPEPTKLDPRDYRAKSVVQRFWIISAGVIMNLLFAPVFAMLAFKYGVPEIPARVGGVMAGGPAYKADFRPGDEIVQIGDQPPVAAISFSDFREANALIGTSGKAVHYVQRKSVSEPIKIEVQPQNDIIQLRYRTIAAVGIQPDVSTRLSKENAIVPQSAASLAEPALENGDVILEVNGETVSNGARMRQLISQNFDKDISLTVARLGIRPITELNDDVERVSIKVPSRKRKILGMEMEFGPVIALQSNSPAATAGIKEGEKLITLNGKAIGDPLTLSFRLRSFARRSESITLGVANAEGIEREVELIPRVPFFRNLDFNFPISIDEIGLAFKVSNEVANVVADSPAKKAGILPGDKIIRAEFIADTADADSEKKIGFPDKHYDFATYPYGWPMVEAILQNRMMSTKLAITVERDKQPKEFSLNWAESDQWFVDARGIRLNSDQIIVKPDSWSGAFSMGMKRVQKDMGRIFNFLRALITGRVSVTTMGGPITIGGVAVSFALEGPGLFLAFLAFISVNLAIVNFLPIPVLDGGHAAFLIWEGVTGKPVNENTQFIASLIGFIFLISLMLFVFSLDILTTFF